MHIEYVHANAWVENHTLDPDVLIALRKDTSIIEAIRSQLGRAQLVDSCIAWLDGEPWEDKCLDAVAPKVRSVLDHAQSSIELLETNLATLEGWSITKELVLRPMIDHPNLMFIEREARLDKDGAISMIIGALEDVRTKRQAIEPLVKEFERIKANLATQRTGRIVFGVGVLNSGDSDGVVVQNARLQFGDSELLPLVADAYTVIKAHSFAEVEFSLDVTRSDPTAREKWEALVLNHAQEKFSISFPAAAGNKQLRAEGRLPP